MNLWLYVDKNLHTVFSRTDSDASPTVLLSGVLSPEAYGKLL